MLERFTWFRQSAYRWDGDGLTLYIDPRGITDPVPADLVLFTHAHFDHFDLDDVAKIRKEGTRFVAPHDVAAELSGDVTPVVPGESIEVAGVRIQTVPAYNVVEARLQAHPRSNNWVGYLLELDGRTYYHAGDTDHVPELEEIRSDVTFLPISGDPFVMSAQEAGGLAKVIGPSVAVPMHYGFIVGSPKLAEEFRRAAAPVPVETLTPRNPFEQT